MTVILVQENFVYQVTCRNTRENETGTKLDGGGAGFESTSCCHVLAGSCVGIALDADTVPSFRS